jgi:hypothetical protein
MSLSGSSFPVGGESMAGDNQKRDIDVAIIALQQRLSIVPAFSAAGLPPRVDLGVPQPISESVMGAPLRRSHF